MPKSNKKTEEVVEEVVTTEEVVEEKPVKSSKKTTPKKGVVINCGLLNVRTTASLGSKVVRCIPVGSEINILGEENDFYKILDGYVMKSFIQV